MIQYDKFQLNNGLKVLLHNDKSTSLATVNLLYDVGARDEHPSKTGFAHLFEHLMFGGSANIPVFDSPLQMVGGENNAFTTNDITNYYITIPHTNIETAFWLESDRMLDLAFSKKSLAVQKNVVIEEYKQRYLNQPFGDVWLLLRPLAYKIHPYLWPTIGKDIKHIEDASLEDVKQFFYNYYRPNNCILCIAGNIDVTDCKELCKKWFGNIPKGIIPKRKLPAEPKQTEKRTLEVERDVPCDAIYKAYHICSRRNSNFYAMDLLSDILSEGNSSRLYNELVKRRQLFSDIDAYVSGDIDEGLFIFSGRLMSGVKMQDAEKAIIEETEKLKSVYDNAYPDIAITEKELQKVKNKVESSLVFGEMSCLNKAMNLALFELLGDASEINKEAENYNAVTVSQLIKLAGDVFVENNCSTLYYYAKK